MPKLPIPPALATIVALQGIGAALLFGSVLVITGALGAEEFGRYAWVVAGGGIAALFIQHGLPTTIVKQFAPLDLASDDALPAARTITFYMALGCAATGGVAAAALYKGDALAFLPRPEAVWIVAIGCALAFAAIADAVLRAADKGLRANIASQLIRPGILVGAALLLSAAGVTDPSRYLALYAASALVGGIVFLGPLPLRYARAKGSAAKTASDPAHFQVSITKSLSNFLPVFIAGLFLPPTEVAYLAIAVQLTVVIQFGLAAARAYFSAKINARIKSDDLTGAKRLLGSAARFSLGIAVLASFGVAGVAAILTQWDGGPLASFTDTHLLIAVFVCVGASRLAAAGFGPVQLAAILLDGEPQVLRITVLSTVFLAGGLIAAGIWGNILWCAAIMPVYSLGLMTSLRRTVTARFKQREQS